ncbi:MAG TPA: hypothetical protein VGN16_10805 [Acidobacteriaceae bacterium]
MKRFLAALLLAGVGATAVSAETVKGLCMVSASFKPENAEVMFRSSDCGVPELHSCNSSDNSNIPWTRWTGVSPEALSHENALLDARMIGEAGTASCSGTVHDGVLAGRYQFTPNEAFVQKMGTMGFDNITPSKQQGFLMLDVTTAWVQQIKDLGVTDLSTNKLMGLRALHVDAAYIHDMSNAGYPELRANKLTEMKAVGVTPEKAREAKAMGFNPTEQELIQMSIFKVDRPFVERMRAKGLKDLTLASLIKVKIFKLDE